MAIHSSGRQRGLTPESWVLTRERPKLVIASGDGELDQQLIERLSEAFELNVVGSYAEARAIAAQQCDCHLVLAHGAMNGEDPQAEVRVLEHLGEGAGLVDRHGKLRWANARLRQYGDETQHRFTETCLAALEHFNQAGAASVPLRERPGRKFTFGVEESYYEAIVSIADVDDAEHQTVNSVVGILWEVTSSRQFQGKLDAIDAAGAELLRIDAASLAKLNMAERLRLLEEKIIKTIRDLLHFDHFEVRLIDRETNQLQLVISMGLAPLRIGEAIYAEPEHNGISGYVAATGRSYICPNIPNDSRYREGLEDACSSLTVPLRLHDKVIGVLNVESAEANSFTEQDLRFAEIFGRYIALAMHILDLLVVERYTTNEQIAANVIRELNEPLDSIAGTAAKLRSSELPEEVQTELDRIIDAVGVTRRRLEACTSGPRSILGAEEELHRAEIDPRMQGKRVLVADNEPNIRDAIADLLRQRGCDVTVCNGGRATIDELESAYGGNERFDLVISDIRMPDRNGYEVFRAAHALDPTIPVILMTGFGYDPHHSIVRASQEGLQSFLFKPLRASHLIEEVQKAFEGSGETA